MTRELESELWKASARTFEGLGFLFPDASPARRQMEAPLEMCSRVGFLGPRRGALEVRLAGSASSVLAANMLGDLDADDDELRRDAVGEVTNVICGNILPAVAGATAEFDLGAPSVVPAPTEAAAPIGCRIAAQVTMGLDGGRAEIRLYLSAPSEDGR